MVEPRRFLVGLASALALFGCPAHKVKPAVEYSADCAAEIENEFGPQRETVLALTARDGGPALRPELLRELDAVLQALEDEAWGGGRMIRGLTNVPIAETRPGGVSISSMRESLDQGPERIGQLFAALSSFEFSRRDLIDSSGRTAFIHLPQEAFPDGPQAAIDLVRSKLTLWQMAADTPQADPSERANFASWVHDGPGSAHLDILFEALPDSDFKEPAALAVLEVLQANIEALPQVVQTFAITDDVKVVRRATHDGSPSWGVIPPKRGEVVNLLNLYEMSGKVDAFGRRLSSDGRLALLRVNVGALNRDERLALAGRLANLLERSNPKPWSRAELCLASGEPFDNPPPPAPEASPGPAPE